MREREKEGGSEEEAGRQRERERARERERESQTIHRQRSTDNKRDGVTSSNLDIMDGIQIARF